MDMHLVDALYASSPISCCENGVDSDLCSMLTIQTKVKISMDGD
jgi:hypothetical protein